jgi:Fic family protein
MCFLIDKTPFNNLTLLPPDIIILTREVLLSMAKTSRSLRKLDGILQKLPNPLMLVNTISLEEAKSSSEIENIFTTDDELYKAISTTDTAISPAGGEVVYTQPYIKSIHIVGDRIKSRNTARKYLDQLCDINVLELKHIDNENVYINNDLVRILGNG